MFFSHEVKLNEVTQSCPTLCDPMNCSLWGFSVHGILQARILEWVAISFSRGSSRPRDWTQVSRIAGRRFTLWATRERYYQFTPFKSQEHWKFLGQRILQGPHWDLLTQGGPVVLPLGKPLGFSIWKRQTGMKENLSRLFMPFVKFKSMNKNRCWRKEHQKK